jgi:cobalt-zinc-cadmium efflux system membrane fusion protein
LLSVPNTSIVTVQGKNYVFVQKTDTQFERREIISGQQINNRIIIFSGLHVGDKVITKGAMQLKGLSFGY